MRRVLLIVGNDCNQIEFLKYVFGKRKEELIMGATPSEVENQLKTRSSFDTVLTVSLDLREEDPEEQQKSVYHYFEA